MKSKSRSTLKGVLAIGGTFALLFWLERRRPLRRSISEPGVNRVARNMALSAVTAGIVSQLERPVVQPLAMQVDRKNHGLLPRLELNPQLETALGLVLMDYSLYLWHVLLHRVPWLWRSHLVHHADLELDTTTALRFHFVEFIASIPWRAAQVRLLGIRPRTLKLWQRLTLLEVLFHHSNLRLPLRVERRLSQILVTPRLHGIHHSTVAEETGSNFSSGLTLWDRLHGTLRQNIPQALVHIGVPAYRSPRELTLLPLLKMPFLPDAPQWLRADQQEPERSSRLLDPPDRLVY